MTYGWGCSILRFHPLHTQGSQVSLLRAPIFYLTSIHSGSIVHKNIIRELIMGNPQVTEGNPFVEIKSLLDKPEKWIKGDFARDALGNPLESGNSTGAACWCLLGARDKVCPTSSPRRRDMSRVMFGHYQHAGEDFNVPIFNDAPGTTFEEVHRLLDKWVTQWDDLVVTKGNNDDTMD